jgi:serine/threonine-protein kinase
MRSMITRSLGREMTCNFDIERHSLYRGDVLVQCTDGLYGCVVDDEILDLASHFDPEEACRKLVSLAEKRQSEDNVSVQVIKIQKVERVVSSRGFSYYKEETRVPVNNELQPGDRLEGRFEIQECISRSGMASIYKALDTSVDKIVALKVPLAQFETDAASFSRFEREEAIGKMLDHPSILKFFPVENKRRPYIVMEYLEGQTLDQVLKDVHPLPEADAAKIASRLCEALEYMHKNNVVHRDLKPQNIMICKDGSIRIMDFGIAKALKMRRITFVGFSPTMGTPDYMAPEQVKGKRGDERTDIYSLGAILYEMTTGATPFEGESPYAIMNARVTGDPPAPRKVNQHLTPVIEEIILHAMERDPARRYPSAAEMKAELDDYEKVELVGRFKQLQSPQLWKSRFRGLPLILGFLALNILGFLAIWYFLASQGPVHRPR